MTTRVLETVADRQLFFRLVETYELPCTVTIRKGRIRSVEQNKTQRLWLKEAAEQLGDNQTPEELRAYCKLHLGVPILRAESDEFCEVYDRIVKPLGYEEKLALMAVPLDMPITRIMTTKQKSTYLDEMWRHFSELGVRLTDPEERKTGTRKSA